VEKVVPPSSSSTVNTLRAVAWPLAVVCVFALGFNALRRPPQPPSQVEVVREGATVIKELRALARLETTTLHVEKVIDLKDHQQRIHGLVEADDRLLFVAAGEVVLGVDLGKVESADVWSEPESGVAHVALPPPEVFSSRFDEQRSYVHARKTDLLARRNEGLESAARQQALRAFDAAGRDPTAIDAAKGQAERELRTLATAWGAKSLVVHWKAAKSEVGVD
jgi:hypothetical protein